MLDLLLTGVCGLALLCFLAALWKACQGNWKLRSPEVRTQGTVLDASFDAFERDLCLFLTGLKNAVLGAP